MKRAMSWLLFLAMLFALAASFAEQAENAEALPESFDLRNVDTDGDGVGDRCYVPPVRQQGPFGTCWGFSATASSEISILGSILEYDPDAWKTIDLSEKQMVYFSHMPLADESNPQNGEGLVTEGKDAKSIFNTGGQPFLAASAYAQGIGPSNEDDERYGGLFRYWGREKNTIQRYINGMYRNYCYSDTDDWSIPEEYRFARDYYLVESVLLPSPAHDVSVSAYSYNPEASRLIKEQLLLKRGVSIGFMADTSRPDQDLSETGVYLNNITWAHYTWENQIANHAVTIIGWDDNYPKENFLAEHQPPENGAWFVRNSWGSGEEEFPNCGEMNWGIPVQKKDENGEPVFDRDGNPVMVGSGYFWLSYYDQSLTTPETFVFTDSIAPEFVDQHDYLQVSDVLVQKYGTPVKTANIFTADHAEVLTEISCMTKDLNTEVKYSVYLLYNDFASPEDGLCAVSGSVRFEYGGYHRIRLSDDVFLQPGQSYAIILEMTDPDGRFVANEYVAAALPGFTTTYPKGVINEKESYLYREGAWKDYSEVTEEEITSDPRFAMFKGESIAFDNFPIKGYGSYIAGNMEMVLNVLNDKKLIALEGLNSTKISLYFRGTPMMEMGNPEIEWALLDGSEEIAEIVPQKEGSQILLTAGKAGTVHLAARVKDQPSLGTALLRLEVGPPAPSSAMAMPFENVYTGEPVTPRCVVKISQNFTMNEGEHYTLKYENNVLCGVADVLVCPTDSDLEPLLAHFMIVPEKAEITTLEAQDGAVRVAVADQWASGIGGYDIEYRKAGEENWQAVELTDGQTETTLQLPEAGAAYEVRARAKVDGVTILIYLPTTCYGEYSDTATFTAP